MSTVKLVSGKGAAAALCVYSKVSVLVLCLCVCVCVLGQKGLLLLHVLLQTSYLEFTRFIDTDVCVCVCVC